MKLTFDLDDEKSWLRASGTIFVGLSAMVLCFVFFSLLSLFCIHFFVCGSADENCCLFAHDIVWNKGVFTAIGNAYANWWDVFNDAFKSRKINLLLFLPTIVPIGSLLFLGWFVFRSSLSLQLWYVLNYHFANFSDVCKMKVNNGKFVILGWFDNVLLKTPEPASVLCVGETGCGKTSTIAVPTILQADNMSVVAVDDSGTLARHSSGYRAKIGKVFYFNWDMCDDLEKNVVFPRFNPLSVENIPIDKKLKGEYFSFIAQYLVGFDKANKDNYWEWLASSTMKSLIMFVVAKCKQAEANDYFLSKILENSRLSRDDKDILLSYYLMMPETYKNEAIKFIENEKLNVDDYMIIGSWGGIPDEWQGKNICLGMLSDWILYSYLAEKGSDGGWRKWIETLIWEAKLFNYGDVVIEGLQQFLYLSKLQRQLVFAKIVRPLKLFINTNIREKTTGNDFKIDDLGGIYNCEAKKWEPVTIYAIAKTKTTKFVNRFIIDIWLKFGLLEKPNIENCKTLVIFDNAGQMSEIKNMSDCVAKGPSKGASILLLCNSFNNMENTYGKEILEELVANTSYKIIMAENNVKLSKQLDKLAIFASKSVQLPKDNRRVFKEKSYFADTNYYHRLALELKGQNRKKLATKGFQVLLTEGYYHRPVLTKNMTFMQDHRLKNKASLPVAYFLDSEIVEKRYVQDYQVPEIDDILFEDELGIDDEVELLQYMNVAYDDALSKVKDEKMEDVLINDISAKWKRNNKNFDDNDNWWMREKAFEKTDDSYEVNPFEIKK